MLPERIDAIRHSTGWKGCSLSHAKCIQTAKDRGYASVLIMEDDAVPASTASYERLCALMPILEKRQDWDIFNAGPSFVLEYAHPPLVPIVEKPRVVSLDPPLVAAQTYGCIAYVVRARAYDMLLVALTPEAVDACTDGSLKIDVLLHRFRTLCSAPHSVVSLNLASDIVGCFMDNEWAFDLANSRLVNLVIAEGLRQRGLRFKC